MRATKRFNYSVGPGGTGGTAKVHILNLELVYIFAFIGSEGASKLIWIFHDLFSSSLSSTFKTFSIASCVLR